MDTIKHFLSDRQAPCIISPKGKSVEAPLNEIVSWLREQRTSLEAEFQSTGGILLRGFKAIQGAEAFEAIISAFSSQAATAPQPRRRQQPGVCFSAALTSGLLLQGL